MKTRRPNPAHARDPGPSPPRTPPGQTASRSRLRASQRFPVRPSVHPDNIFDDARMAGNGLGLDRDDRDVPDIDSIERSLDDGDERVSNSDDSDFHDLSLTRDTRASIVDNMLLSLDFYSEDDDDDYNRREHHRATRPRPGGWDTRTHRQRGRTSGSFSSADLDLRPRNSALFYQQRMPDIKVCW